MKIKYNHKLVPLARKLRNNSTKSEIKLWQHLKNKQIRGYSFHCQKPIGNSIADFFCFKLKLVIEIDGVTHNELSVQENDKLKELYFKEIGISVLRFQDCDVMDNIEGVFLKIASFIDEYEKPHTP